MAGRYLQGRLDASALFGAIRILARDSEMGASAGQALRSADRRMKDPHIVAACNFARLFGCEAATQHRRDELHPLRVVLHTARGDLLISTDTDVIYPDDIDHLLQPFDIFVKAREEVPDAD